MRHFFTLTDELEPVGLLQDEEITLKALGVKENGDESDMKKNNIAKSQYCRSLFRLSFGRLKRLTCTLVVNKHECYISKDKFWESKMVKLSIDKMFSVLSN